MQVHISGPVGDNGGIEDIPDAYEQSASIIQRCHTKLQHAQERKCTFESVYREFAKPLRCLIEQKAPESETAKGLLRRITLQQTLPWNELETPHYQDSYTGAELTGEEEPDAVKFSAVEPVPEWDYYAANRKPYATDELNEQFVKANTSPTGDEEEDEDFCADDREYEPEYLKVEGQTDDDFEMCWAILKPIEEKIEFLAEMQKLADADINPANLARIYIWKMGRLRLSPEMAETIRLPNPLKRMPKGKKSQWADDNLRSWINMFYDEIFEYMDACGAVHDDSMTNQEIDDQIDLLFAEYIENMDDSSPNPVRQKRWIEGYIHAVTAGLPIKRIENNYTASDAAWDAWRTALSPRGQEAYQKRLLQNASRREAMRNFYQIAYSDGVLKPGRPKSIQAIRPTGLLLTNGKFVGWSVALKIDNEEGFDLTPERRGELREILEQRGWGPGFAKTL